MGIAEKKMQNKDFVGAHPNVHYKCAGLPTTSFSTYLVVVPGMSRTGSTKPVAPSVQFTPSPSATSVNMSSEQTNAATSSLVVEYLAKQETKTNGEMEVSISSNVPNAEVLEDQACFSSNTASDQVQEDQAALSSTEVVPENKKAGHQLENDNLSSDEPYQSYSVETRTAWRTLESTLA